MALNPHTLARFDAGWTAPTTEELRSLLRDQGWSGSQAGRIVGVDSRTVRRWTGGQTPIPYAAWRLLLLEAGLLGRSAP